MGSGPLLAFKNEPRLFDEALGLGDAETLRKNISSLRALAARSYNSRKRAKHNHHWELPATSEIAREARG